MSFVMRYGVWDMIRDMVCGTEFWMSDMGEEIWGMECEILYMKYDMRYGVWDLWYELWGIRMRHGTCDMRDRHWIWDMDWDMKYGIW